MCSTARAGEGFREQLRGPGLLVLPAPEMGTLCTPQKIHTNVTSEMSFLAALVWDFSQLCSSSCHQEKGKKKKKPLSDHVTCFSCDQYLIILILLAARACLLSYLSTHGGMPALPFRLAVCVLQSVSGWRHLDADRRRCRDGEARAFATQPRSLFRGPGWKRRSPSCDVMLPTGLVKTGKRRCVPMQMRKNGLSI